MMKYFKKSKKHSKTHHDSTGGNHPSTNQCDTTHADKHKCKPHNTNDQVNEIIGQTNTLKPLNQNLKIKTHMTPTVWMVTLTLLHVQNDHHELMKL